MDSKRSKLEAFSRTNFAQISVVEQLVLVKLVLNVGERKLSAPDGNIQFAENPGQGPDVIFVSVSKHDAAHMLAVFQKIGNVRNNDVDAQ